jgi:hypothetical protein
MLAQYVKQELKGANVDPLGHIILFPNQFLLFNST